jgi:uncharacterized protein YndB with AHSA1/START domain
MQDAIIREITVKASPEKVYRAISDPTEIIKWFPEAVEGGTLEPGQEPTFVFRNGESRRRVIIEAANPFDYFAYRWAPGPDGLAEEHVLDLPNTLIEFLIEVVGDETKVTVKESGFAALPPEYAHESHHQNSGGWEFMMDRLSLRFN